MCGIAGVVERDRPLADVSRLAATLDASLAHRGPDGAGSWTSPPAAAPGVLFVHRRLAIIDPGPGGAQPMSTADGRHHIVFNGEIYNYRELRTGLESRGVHISSASDTEVLLQLVALDGPAGLARVRGMFAFACWDAKESSLLIARDRFGIKPLYVAATPRRIAFASELGTLRASGLTPNEVSAGGVLAFLEWGSVPPPLTWTRGVEMLVPERPQLCEGGVVDADARSLVLGFRVPQLELSPGASLLRRRPVLPAACAAARPDSVLRAPRHAVANLWRSGVRLARREPGSAHRLVSGWNSCRSC